MSFTTCAGVALSAAAFGLYARVEWPWILLGWFGLIPWLASLERVTSLRQALLSGACMSVAFVGAVFWWFVVGIGEYTNGSLLVPAFAVALLAPLFQPQFIPVAVVHRLTRRVDAFWARAATIALTYCAVEWIVPKLFGDTIGHGLYASRLLRQAADLTGAPGLTFVLLLVNQSVLEAIKRRNDGRHAATPLLVAGAVIALLFGYGTYRLHQLEAAEAGADKITVALVQANISHYAHLAEEMGTYDATRYIVDTHFALSQQALARGDVDLLVWPETVYPTTFGAPKSEAGAQLDGEIAAFATVAGVPLIFGAYHTDGAAEYNAAIFLQATGGRITHEAYRKGSLFPLTERVPWPLDTAAVRAWMPWLGTWKPGDPARVLTLTRPSGRPLRIAPLICYDAVDGGRALAAVGQGADVIVTLSNDSWFAAGGGPRLHLVVSAFRSLETRRSQIRATNTGISAFITPAGDIVAGAGAGERAVVRARLPLADGPSTLMLAWGDWFGRASCGFALGCLGVLAAGARRS